MSFNSLHPPPKVIFTATRSAIAMNDRAAEAYKSSKAAKYNEKLVFKAIWVEWLCLVICSACSALLAMQYWQDDDTIWIIGLHPLQ